MNKTIVTTLTMILAGTAFAAEPVYQNDFEKIETGKVPEDFLVLDGAFGVKEEAGNKFLELPGAPLDTYGVLFGPTESAGFSVSARIHGTGKGRRFPAFAVGLNGVGGVRLQVSPAKKMLELYRGDEVIASVTHAWESDSWTTLRLQLRKKDGELIAEGKAWKHGMPETKGWNLTQKVAGDLPAGRASVWGNPFSGTPIRFDDFQVTPASDQP